MQRHNIRWHFSLYGLLICPGGGLYMQMSAVAYCSSEEAEASRAECVRSPYALTFLPSAEAAPASLAPAEEEGAAGKGREGVDTTERLDK